MTRNRILLVEDEAIIALAERTMLERNGYTVTTAATGEAAIEAVRGNDAMDLVLMDINLGDGISGTEAAQTILAERNVPLIFLSSHTERKTVETTEGITSYGYVVKTAGETVLLASIRMAFRLFEAKEAERRSEVRYRTTLAALNVGLFERDTAAGTLYLSPSYYTMLGYEPDEFPSTDAAFFALLHPDDRDRLEREIDDAIAEFRNQRDIEFRVRARDGSYRTVLGSSRVVERDASGRATRIVGTDTDVTESIDAKRRLQQTSAFLLSTERIARSASWRYDLETGEETWSPGEYELHGVDPSVTPSNELHMKTVHPEDRAAHRTALSKNVRSGERHFEERFRYVMPDGSIRHILSAYEIERDESGNALAAMGSDRDITEFVAAQRRVDDAEFLSELAMEAGQVATWDLNVSTGELKFSPTYLTMLGYDEDELPASFETFEKLLHPEDRVRSRTKLKDLLDGVSEDNENVLRFRAKSGDWVWFRTRGQVVERDNRGNAVRFVGANINIDALKRTADELAAERELLGHYLRVAGVMLIRLDREMRVTSINDGGCEILGCTREVAVGADWIRTFIPARFRTEIEAVATEIFAGDGGFLAEYENPILRIDGSERMIAWHNSTVCDDDGNVVGILCSGTDVTEWRENESTYAETERRYRQLFESQGIGVGFYDPSGRVIEFNTVALNTLGLPADEVVGKSFDDLFPAEAAEYNRRLRQTIENAKTLSFEDDVQFPSGTMSFLSMWSPVFADSGDLIGIQVASVDVSESRSARREIDAFFAQPINLHLVARLDGTIVRTNRGWTTTLGYDHEQLIGTDFFDLIHPDDLEPTRREAERLGQGIETSFFENRYRAASGKYRFLGWSAVADTTEGTIYAVARDMTDQVEANAALRETLAEKEALLRELQHRAKNSFAMLANLVDLTAARSAGAEARNALVELEARVRAIAQLYDLLYQTESVSDVMLDRYLERIVETLRPVGGGITLETHFEAIHVPAQVAIPVGIIVTELITNVPKHASGEATTIRVDLTTRDGVIVASVGDDGPGYPAGATEGGTLGLSLIDALARQIDGTFSTRNDNGAVARLELPLPVV